MALSQLAGADTAFFVTRRDLTIAQICPQVIEFGPPNATIHKIDEHIAVADIEPLKNIYRRTLENLAGVAAA